MITKVGGRECLLEGAQIIKDGGLVAFPTETVYGLGANALDAAATKQIFEAKGRPTDNPFIVHLASAKDVERVAKDIPNSFWALMEAFAPGPLTVVLNKRSEVPSITTGGRDTVAVRIPNHPMALALIEASGLPIAAPSANTSGRVSPTTAQHVLDDLNGKIPLILDGGGADVGLESTVLDLTVSPPVILRPGAVTAKMLSTVLPSVLTHNGEVVEARAPGMKYAHYEPLCGAMLAKTPNAARQYIKTHPEQNPVVVGSDAFLATLTDVPTKTLGKTQQDWMQNLFLVLREAERQFGLVIIEEFPSDDQHRALYNRIQKATAGKRVEDARKAE